MSTTTLVTIAVVVAVVVILLLIVYFVSRSRRSQRQETHRERTREEFGSEYERTAEERGSEEEAERELRERRGRVERQVRPLSDESRERFEGEWAEVERIFVDNPERSIEMADRTVSDILVERNFVADAAQSDEETEKALAVTYPDVADDYREARRKRAEVVSRSAQSSESDSGEEAGQGAGEERTEELRQAIRKYRTVYERLVTG